MPVRPVRRHQTLRQLNLVVDHSTLQLIILSYYHTLRLTIGSRSASIWAVLLFSVLEHSSGKR